MATNGNNNIGIRFEGNADPLFALMKRIEEEINKLQGMAGNIGFGGSGGMGGGVGGGGSSPVSGSGAGGAIGSSVNPTRTAATATGRTMTTAGGPPSIGGGGAGGSRRASVDRTQAWDILRNDRSEYRSHRNRFSGIQAGVRSDISDAGFAASDRTLNAYMSEGGDQAFEPWLSGRRRHQQYGEYIKSLKGTGVTPYGETTFNSALDAGVTMGSMGFGMDATQKMYGRPTPTQPGDPTIAYTPAQKAAATTGPPVMNPFDPNFNGLGPLADLSAGRKIGLGMAAAGAAHTWAAYNDIGTNELMSGRPDFMGRARTTGALVGGALGGAVAFGLTGNPIASAMAANAGATIGGSIMNRFGATAERDALTVAMLHTAGGLQANMQNIAPRPFEGDTMYDGSRGIIKIPAVRAGSVVAALGQKDIVRGIRASSGLRMGITVDRKSGRATGNDDMQPFLAGDDEIATAFATAQESLIGGGRDPYTGSFSVASAITSSSRVPALSGSERSAVEKAMKDKIAYDNQLNDLNIGIRSGKIGGVRFNDGKTEMGKSAADELDRLQRLANKEIEALDDQLRKMKTITTSTPVSRQVGLAEFITQNLSDRYGPAATDISKQIAPLLSSAPETGMNSVDMLTKFGSIATSRYYEAMAPIGQTPQLQLNRLMQDSANLRGWGRRIDQSQYMVRGGAGQAEESYQAQMDIAERLPDGKDSTFYMQANAGRRSSMFRRFQSEDIEDYELPMTRLRGRMERSELLPFSPGNMQGDQLNAMRLRSSQMSRMSQRYRTLKANGDLSESEELAMTNSWEQMASDQARGQAFLAEGFIDRLPAMSSGRPRNFQRFSTEDMAASNLALIGHPGRFFGSTSGSHLKAQNDHIRSMQLPSSIQMGVGSTTQELNTTNSLLKEILQTMKTNGSGNNGFRPAEEVGRATANLSRASLGTQQAYSQMK